MSLETVKKLTDEIKKCLALRVDRDNGDEVSGILQELIIIQDTASEAMALSTMVYADKISELYESPAFSGMSATDKKMVINGRASKEVYFLTLAERLSRSVSHSIDGYRSILSDIKAKRLNYSGM